MPLCTPDSSSNRDRLQRDASVSRIEDAQVGIVTAKRVGRQQLRRLCPFEGYSPSDCEQILEVRIRSNSRDAAFESSSRKHDYETQATAMNTSLTDCLFTSAGIMGARMSQRFSLRSSPPISEALLSGIVLMYTPVQGPT
jgi:hypothetical protein